MEIAELFSTDFVLSNHLSGADVASLDDVRRLLDSGGASVPNAAAIGSETALEKTAVRQRALELLETTGFDIQALIVLVRAITQDDLEQGLLLGLQLVDKVLGAPWEGLQANVVRASDPAKEARKLSRHFDTLFNHLHEVVAREYERDSEQLLRAFSAHRAKWVSVLDTLDVGLKSRRLAYAGWQNLQALVIDCIKKADDAMATTDESISGMKALSDAASAADVLRHEQDDRGGSGVKPLVGSHQGLLSVSLRVSPEFLELQKQLEAFQLLLARDDYEKAALVASELHARLSEFDAASFFPDLFAGLFEGQAKHAQKLEPYAELQDTPRTGALRRLYRSALERFLAEGSTSSERSR